MEFSVSILDEHSNGQSASRDFEITMEVWIRILADKSLELRDARNVAPEAA
ncbi:MAG: hypothetical protein WCO60_19210 [Verrucomicrobiota bacterium]